MEPTTIVKQLIAFYSKRIPDEPVLLSYVLTRYLNSEIDKGRHIALFSLPEMSDELMARIQSVIDEYEK